MHHVISYRFFQLMGSVFGFVSSDLKEKIQILNDLINKDDQNYTTIKSMIQYEKENKILDKGDYTNGARTLLRLHRGLGIIMYESFFVKIYCIPLTNVS